MAVDMGASRQVRLIAPPGSIVVPTLGGYDPARQRPLVLRMAWTANESPALTVAIAPESPTPGAGLMLQARDLGAPGLALRPIDARLVVDMAVVPDSRNDDHGGIGLHADRGRVLIRQLRITTPPGQQVVVMLPGETALRAGLGSSDDQGGSLALRGFASGDAGAGDTLAIADIVCGTPANGAILWQRIFPQIKLEDCRDGGLTVSGLVAEKGLILTAAGIAFVRKDDVTATWSGLRFLHENIVVQALITALLATLTGWLGVALGNRGKA